MRPRSRQRKCTAIDACNSSDAAAGLEGSQSSSLVYLSSVPVAAGGATCFPRAGLSVQPSAGDGLLWYNTHVDGRVDAESVHLSEPVLGGTGAVKWALSKWLRQGRFTVDRETFASEGW